MRVLLLAQNLPVPPDRDGGTVRVHHLFREFAARGDCHLVGFADESGGEQDLELPGGGASYRAVRHSSPGRLLGLAKKALSARRFYSSAMVQALEEDMRVFRPDVVMAEQTFMAQYADTFGDVPKVMSAVDAISLAASRHAETDHSLFGALAWRYVARQRLATERRYFGRFDAVTCVAEEDARYLRARLGIPIQVIPNGVDGAHFGPAFRSAQPDAVAFTGNLSAPMNEEACLYLFEQVFPELNKRFPGLKLVVAGRGPTDRLRRKAPDFVQIRADVPDMRDVLADTKVLLCPIAYGTGIKNNALQAMAMGIPVVCTPMIAEPLGMIHCREGFVGGRDEYLRVLCDALSDPGAMQDVGRRGMEHVLRNFTWSGVAERYFSLFESILAAGRGPAARSRGLGR